MVSNIKYQISNTGIVRSLDRIVNNKNGSKRFWKGKVLLTGKTPTGYEFVGLKIAGNINQQYIHRLVALHFIPNPENKKTVNHIDGDKANNNDWNLEWNTSKENTAHGYKTGLMKKGQDCSYSKLTALQVLSIRENKNNLMYKDLAMFYSVSPMTIGNIMKRKVWKHI